MAVWYGELDIVQLLLSKGADGTAKDSKGRNSLHAMTFYSPERHGCLTYPWHYWIRHGNWDEHLQRKNGLTKVLVDAGADLEELDRVYPRSTPLMLASDEKDGGATCALLNAGADANGAREGSGNTGESETATSRVVYSPTADPSIFLLVLHEWARKPAFSLDYPESYLYVFKRIADATSDANVRNSYDKEGPLHFLVNAAHTREDARKGLDILLTHRPPADINLTNRRGETALYIAFDTGHLKQGREERALDLVDAGASLFTHRDDGRDIIFPVANNKGLHDADSLQLIRRLLSHVAEAENTTIVQAYQRHFLSHSGSILALSAAASGGRVETTKFLLDLGLSTRLNQPFKDPGGGNRSPPCTVLDTTLAAAIYTRQLHMDRLARFSPGAARDRALASNAVYDAASSSQGSPARAAEAYAGLPAVLRELRSRGAKRACELDPIPDPAVLKMDKMGAENHPDLWDVMIMYSLGFTPRTQPNRKRQAIVYELARYPTDWREQLVEVLWWMHQFVWLPHLNMLKDAVRVVRGHDENPSVSPAGSTNNNDIVVDVEFLRKMLAMLFEKGRKEPSTKVIDFSALSLDDQDQQQQTASTSSWIEVTEALKYGSGAELNSSTNHLVEVELLEGGIKIGEVRRTLREGDGI
jgi:ankyrin repeat protein